MAAERTSARKRPKEIRTSNTHLYPGARLFDIRPGKTALNAGDHLTIAFSDSTRVHGHVLAADGAIARVRVDGYRTKSGTDIEAKTWFLRKSGSGQAQSYSVIGLAP